MPIFTLLIPFLVLLPLLNIQFSFLSFFLYLSTFFLSLVLFLFFYFFFVYFFPSDIGKYPRRGGRVYIFQYICKLITLKLLYLHTFDLCIQEYICTVPAKKIAPPKKNAPLFKQLPEPVRLKFFTFG
jgi:hypothetical protein